MISSSIMIIMSMNQLLDLMMMSWWYLEWRWRSLKEVSNTVLRHISFLEHEMCLHHICLLSSLLILHLASARSLCLLLAFNSLTLTSSLIRNLSLFLSTWEISRHQLSITKQLWMCTVKRLWYNSWIDVKSVWKEM